EHDPGPDRNPPAGPPPDRLLGPLVPSIDHLSALDSILARGSRLPNRPPATLDGAPTGGSRSQGSARGACRGAGRTSQPILSDPGLVADARPSGSSSGASSAGPRWPS